MFVNFCTKLLTVSITFCDVFILVCFGVFVNFLEYTILCADAQKGVTNVVYWRRFGYKCCKTALDG